MIRNEFPERLRLENKTMPFVIATVGKTEQELYTKMYKVLIYGPNNRMVQIIKAVGRGSLKTS